MVLPLFVWRGMLKIWRYEKLGVNEVTPLGAANLFIAPQKKRISL
jgi:hypothetical protein